MTKARRPAATSVLLLVLGLIGVAYNLRPALASIAPLLAEIRADLGLGTAMAGVLTTLPVLCLGLFGPAAPRLARRFGPERAIMLALAIIGGGILLRTLGGTGLLFAGTAVAGAGIGIAGVLLPGLVKQHFPGRAGLMTGLYTMTLCLGAASAIAGSVPLALDFGGWRPATLFWCLPALVAMVLWLPQLRAARPLPAERAGGAPAPLWRDPVAWQVTGFLGLQSALAYAVFGWLPTILRDLGFGAVEAGFISSLSILSQMATALLIPLAAGRRGQQRPLVLLVMGLTLIGFAAITLGPSYAVLPAAIILGFGQGGTFGLGLTLIVLRAPNAETASRLSGMAQSFGYTMAALGPFGTGLLHDLSGDWLAPTLGFALIALLATACGLGAGRAVTVTSSE